MDEHILHFVSALRAAGVRVSPPEAAEALVAAGSVELDDRHTFRAALRGTLVKRSTDLDVFEQLFELYFSPYGSRGGQLPEVDPLEDLPELPREALEALGAELRDLLERLERMSDLELALLVREAGREAIEGLESLLQRGMVGRAILDGLGAGSGADAALDRFQAAVRCEGSHRRAPRTQARLPPRAAPPAPAAGCARHAAHLAGQPPVRRRALPAALGEATAAQAAGGGAVRHQQLDAVDRALHAPL